MNRDISVEIDKHFSTIITDLNKIKNNYTDSFEDDLFFLAEGIAKEIESVRELIERDKRN